MVGSFEQVNGTGPEIRRKNSKRDMDITGSLEELQTDEQRRILDTVAQVRKCGLESILSLPQLVVCGDQSAGIQQKHVNLRVSFLSKTHKSFATSPKLSTDAMASSAEVELGQEERDEEANIWSADKVATATTNDIIGYITDKINDYSEQELQSIDFFEY
ncbi:hypothetical protein B0O99DRAFT_694620 [Bisporella sp. PMI_857]|nr:hypothetical protein B0O99DRAFT_694620 [Bisporella sp. PMI_857]